MVTHALHPFFEVTSVELGYVLGLLYADGNLDRGRVVLVQKERELLDRIGGLVDRPVMGPYVQREVYHSYSLTLGGVVLAAHLQERYGLGSRKSLTKVWPTALASEWDRDFIRGYFDGNGSLTEYRTHKPGKGNEHCREATITSGSEAFLTELVMRLTGLGVPLKRLRGVPGAQAWRVFYSGQATLRALQAALYYPGCLCWSVKESKLVRILAEFQQ